MRRDRRTMTTRPALMLDRELGTMTVGRRSVAMASAPEDNASILRAYLKLVAEQRGVPAGKSVLLRRRDIAVLADFLDLDDDDLERKLTTILEVPAEEAADLRNQLRRHRLAAAAVGVGMIAAPLAGEGAAAKVPSGGVEPLVALSEGGAFDASPAPEKSTITVDALARMDAVVESTPPVSIAKEEWPSRRRARMGRRITSITGRSSTQRDTTPTLADVPVEIGEGLLLERSLPGG